ncbi:hypothetical protein DRO02_06645 [archaeon]|nr:MAG: hypothetical protein DRO21_06775 [archaeon]RLG63418.1 MAG: hypothetical protein DRO02_06645 [archaeon]
MEGVKPSQLMIITALVACIMLFTVALIFMTYQYSFSPPLPLEEIHSNIINDILKICEKTLANETQENLEQVLTEESSWNAETASETATMHLNNKILNLENASKNFLLSRHVTVSIDIIYSNITFNWLHEVSFSSLILKVRVVSLYHKMLFNTSLTIMLNATLKLEKLQVNSNYRIKAHVFIEGDLKVLGAKVMIHEDSTESPMVNLYNGSYLSGSAYPPGTPLKVYSIDHRGIAVVSKITT